MFPILFRIGPITIYTYGVLVFLGILVGYLFSLKEAKKENIDSKVLTDIIFWSIICGFLGARIFYILVEFKYFLKNPLSFVFSRAGFVFYGGVIFGLATFYLLTKKHRLDFLQLGDIVALSIPLGHSLGRLGCFSYGCCYGKPTTSWIGIKFPLASPAGSSGVKVIPTQLISAFFLILIFFILLIIRRKQRFKGQIILSYFTFYGLFRFIIEFYRGDPRGHIGFLSTSQFISLIVIGVSLFIWIKKLKLSIRGVE